MSDGKTQRALREHAVTFRWEVGLALSFVGPINYQVSIATETIGDLIYKNKAHRTKKQNGMLFFWHYQLTHAHACSYNMRMKHSVQTLTLDETDMVSIFLLCSCCIKQERWPGTSSLHWGDSCCGNSLIFQPAKGTYWASTLRCAYSTVQTHVEGNVPY